MPDRQANTDPTKSTPNLVPGRGLAAAVVALVVAVTVALGWYVGNNLGMNTDTDGLLSPDLPYIKRVNEYRAAFPSDRDNLLIVLDGPNVDKVADGAVKLAKRLRGETSIIQTVFYPDGDPFFRKNGLLYLSEAELTDLSGRLAQAQPLLSTLAEDPSLRGLFDVLGAAADNLKDGGTPDAGLESALARIRTVIEARTAGRKASLSWIELMQGGDFGPADRMRTIIVQPRLDFGSLQPGKRAMETVRAAAKALGLTPENGVRVRLTGSVALKTEELKSVETGASLAGLFSLALVTVLLIAGLRSGRLLFAVLLTLIVGLVWTAAFATVTIGELNLLSVAFAVLFIGLGIDFGIHCALRYREAVLGGLATGPALVEAVRGVRGALMLATATTSVAFLSFVPTDYRGISELGIIAAAGVAIAMVLNLTLLPTLLVLLPVRNRRGGKAIGPTIDASPFVRRHARPITLAALALGLAALPLVAQMRFDHNPLNLRDLGTESVQTVLELIALSDAPYTASVLVRDRRAAEDLAKRLAALPLVDKTVTIADYVPKKQADKLAIIEDTALFLAPVVENQTVKPKPTAAERRAAFEDFQSQLDALAASKASGPLVDAMRRLRDALKAYATKTGLADAALLDLEAALVGTLPPRLTALRESLEAMEVTEKDLPADIRGRVIGIDGQFRVEIFPKEDMSDNRQLQAFVAQVRTVAPEATDSPIGILEGGRVVVSAFYQASVTALIAILVLLTVLLRRIFDVLFVLAPVVLAGVLTVAVAYLVGLDFNLANIIVLPLLLGLGVDSGIHLVMRARDQGDGHLLRTSTPRAVLFSALTTLGSFGSLMVSGHRGTASMGALLTIAIAMTLICALIVLPAMMAWRDGNAGR